MIAMLISLGAFFSFVVCYSTLAVSEKHNAPGQDVFFIDIAPNIDGIHVKMGVCDIETPALIRYGQLTNDEFFISEAAAKEGVKIINISDSDPIVMLKHFGPRNPDLAL